MKSNNHTRLDFTCGVDFSEILTNPILDIAARFWDHDRYEAFRICYRSMRWIDDLVDHRKGSATGILKAEAEQLRGVMFDWLEAVRNKDTSDPLRRQLVDVLEKFRIPFWPWERFYASMMYDLENDGYWSFLTFLRYCEGAAVAPASVFMHLCGVSRADDSHARPNCDIRLAARPLALFSYLVHIIRDFQKDQLSNLNYFADDLLSHHDLTQKDLREVAEGGSIPQSFRDLIATYVSVADYYRVKARRVIDDIIPMLQPRYQLSVEMIYELYLQIFEKIAHHNGRFTGSELNPSPDEVKSRIRQTIDGFTSVSR
ncbi:MAG: phytoene/squalene synthase family protein [Candidatus Zixiibacteriota bacterium]